MIEDNDKRDETILPDRDGDYAKTIEQMWEEYRQKMTDETSISLPTGETPPAPENQGDLFENLAEQSERDVPVPEPLQPSLPTEALTTAEDAAEIALQPEAEAFPPPEQSKLRAWLEKRRLKKELKAEARLAESKKEAEEEEEEEPESRFPIHRRSGRRFGFGLGILYALVIIAAGIAIGLALWVAASDVLGFGKESSLVEVTIPSSIMSEGEVEIEDEDGTVHTEIMELADVSEVAQILEDHGLIRYKKLFELFCKISHANRKIRPGTYLLNTEYDYRALVMGMRPYADTRVETEVTIPEGYTLEKIFTLLEEKGVCSKELLYETAANYDFDYDFLKDTKKGDKLRLEGFLFPDTYKFYLNDDPDRVIDKFLSNFDDKFTEEYRARAEELGYSIRDVVIIASLIEKEAANDSERDTIASVIYNRLSSDDFPVLAIDAAIWYAIAGTDQEFSTDIDSPYNTYTNEGLPPGPISNPGNASIRGALYPVSSDYYYYALHKDGTHRFFTSSWEHNQFVNSPDYAYYEEGED